MKPEDYAGREPRLLLERYFAGKTKAWGLFQDRFGQVRRQFTVDIEGAWDGSRLTLVEDFDYDDGETEQRIWRIDKTGEHDYRGQADDVIGVASGRAFGNTMNWRYKLALKVGGERWTVHFDDWLFLLDDDTIVNRATVTKFGIEIGQVTLVFRKILEDGTQAADLDGPPADAAWNPLRGNASADPSYHPSQ